MRPRVWHLGIAPALVILGASTAPIVLEVEESGTNSPFETALVIGASSARIGHTASKGARNAEQATHPDRRLITRVARRQSPAAFSEARESFAEAFGLREGPRAIGEMNAPEELVFGEIVDIAIDVHGRILALDRQMNQLRVLDTSGNVVQRLGRAGSGPGEYRRPTAVLANGQGRVYVADVARRIQVYEQEGDSLEFARTTQLTVGPLDLCGVDQEFVVVAPSATLPTALHMFDRTGAALRSFGEVYRTNNALLRYEFLRGQVVCSQATGLIVYAPTAWIGDIRAYRSDGSAEWLTTIEDFITMQGTADSEGGIRPAPLTNGFHRLLSLVALPNGDVLAQYGHAFANPSEGQFVDRNVYSLLLDGSTGRMKGAYRGGPVVRAATESMMISVVQDPFPQLHVFARR